MALPDLRKHFEEHGWALIKNVFTEDEIEKLRGNTYKTKENGHKGDVLSNPLLQSILEDERLIQIFKDVLPGQPVYFGDGNFLINNKEFGFHKDNPDRKDPNGPDWAGNYDIFRAGIYLQNYDHDSGGVLLRDKSLNTMSIVDGRPFNAPVCKGDVLIWNLRTTHSGNAKLFKLFPKLIINPKYYPFVPKFMLRGMKAQRAAIFITIAREGKHFDRYIKYLKSRQYAVNYWQNSVYDPEVVAKVESHGLKVIDMRPQVMDLKVETLNEFHKDIPY